MRNKNTFILFIALLVFPIFGNAQNPVDFELTSETDSSQFKLSESKGQYVALHFLLKTECPYCLQHTHDYFIKSKELPNVTQVFIKPDSGADIEAWEQELKGSDAVDYPIYRDPEAKLAKAYKVPDGYYFHKQFVHYPAFILLDTEGKEVFRYVGKNNRDRFSFEQLVRKMKDL